MNMTLLQVSEKKPYRYQSGLEDQSVNLTNENPHNEKAVTELSARVYFGDLVVDRTYYSYYSTPLDYHQKLLRLVDDFDRERYILSQEEIEALESDEFKDYIQNGETYP
jgi:hypothetical protein